MLRKCILFLPMIHLQQLTQSPCQATHANRSWPQLSNVILRLTNLILLELWFSHVTRRAVVCRAITQRHKTLLRSMTIQTSYSVAAARFELGNTEQRARPKIFFKDSGGHWRNHRLGWLDRICTGYKEVTHTADRKHKIVSNGPPHLLTALVASIGC